MITLSLRIIIIMLQYKHIASEGNLCSQDNLIYSYNDIKYTATDACLCRAAPSYDQLAWDVLESASEARVPLGCALRNSRSP